MSIGNVVLIKKASVPNLSIPDHCWKGVQDDLEIDEHGQLESMEVDVHIEHPYILDMVDFFLPRWTKYF